MEGVTDQILSSLPKIKDDESQIKVLLGDLRHRHVEAVEQCIKDNSHRLQASEEIDALLQRLERMVYGISYTEELTPKTQDYAVSFGERLSVRVLAAVLREMGVKARACDADDIGILTDGVFGAASPLLHMIERRFHDDLRPQVEQGLIPIITGFFGCDIDGHVTVFGRGGSDYSAAIIANALNAERLEVWKDVDGFLTADPRVVSKAIPVDRMSYDEAAELAYLGAEILHPRTVEPVAKKSIPIVVKNTVRPEAEGTIIERVAASDRHALISVAAKDGLAILKLYGPGMAYTPGVGQRVFTALGGSRVNVYNMAASQANFALLIDSKDIERGLRALQSVQDGVVQGIEPIDGMSLVCVVGKGIGAVPGTAGHIFTAVGKAGVNVEMISVGASDIALNFVVKTQDKMKAIAAVHDHFLRQVQG
jgi:aspartate kinase